MAEQLKFNFGSTQLDGLVCAKGIFSPYYDIVQYRECHTCAKDFIYSAAELECKECKLAYCDAHVIGHDCPKWKQDHNG